jgi:hypothetical protein
MLRPLSLIKEILFRIAFGLCVVIQIVLWFFMVGGMLWLFHSNRRFVEGIFLTTVFAGLFPIGAANYFLFHRIIREEYIPTEAEKWLAERRRTNTQRIKRRKTLKRWALWIPSVSVILILASLDYTWAFASHLLHPGRGKLIGYEVSIPLTWTFRYADLGAIGNGVHVMVIANRFRGLWKAGSGLYVGRRPFSTSTMDFRTIPNGDWLAMRPDSATISERTLTFGKETIQCREEVRPRWMETGRQIRCFTPTADFSGYFIGSDEDADEFYRVIKSIKHR